MARELESADRGCQDGDRGITGQCWRTVYCRHSGMADHGSSRSARVPGSRIEGKRERTDQDRQTSRFTRDDRPTSPQTFRRHPRHTFIKL